MKFGVTLEKVKFLAQLTGQPKAPVLASARNEFFYEIVNAQLSFVRDPKGKVVALILHQNGLDQKATKVR